MYGERSSKRKALVGTLSKKLLANSTNNSTALSIKYFPKVGINDLQLLVRKSDMTLPKTIWIIACKHSMGISNEKHITLADPTDVATNLIDDIRTTYLIVFLNHTST